MTTSAIGDVFQSTKSTLDAAGIEDDFFLDLLAARLVVERAGETNNIEWWDSRVLSKTGRARLSEVAPKTQLKSRIGIALEVGRKAERNRLPEDSISLFSFGPQLESRVSAALEEITNGDTHTLDDLEELSFQTLTEGWSEDVINEFAPDTSSPSEPNLDAGTGDSYVISDRGYSQQEIERDRRQLLTEFIRGYGYSTNRLQVPYYRLESELKSENA